MDITAEQARKNSESSTYGMQQELDNIYRSIKCVSKTGSTKIVESIMKESISDDELEPAIAELKSKGFNVEVKDHPTFRDLYITW